MGRAGPLAGGCLGGRQYDQSVTLEMELAVAEADNVPLGWSEGPLRESALVGGALRSFVVVLDLGMRPRRREAWIGGG